MVYGKIENGNLIRLKMPLKIDGKDVFTNSEKILNEQGYYRLVNNEYPQDEKAYQPVYSLENNVIVQGWVEVEMPESIPIE